MDFPRYARILALMIRRADPAQMTIGLFGGFGSGKTTLLRAIERELRPSELAGEGGEKTADEENGVGKRDEFLDKLVKDLEKPDDGEDANTTWLGEQNRGPLLTVWFNAWRYEHEEHLFLPFLATILRELGNKATVSKYIWATLKAIILKLSLKVKKGFFEVSVEDIGKAAVEQVRSDLEGVLVEYTDVYEGLKETVQKSNDLVPRIVVMIDDLDRCMPKKAFALLESLKTFMDIDGFIFVLALDPRAIGTYLKGKFEDDLFVTADEYLEKMIQVPFYLPKATGDNLREEIVDVLEKLSDICEWAKQMRGILLKEREMAGGDTGNTKFRFIDYFPSNLRKAKRILNMHQTITAVDQTLDKEFILALLIVQNRWPFAYWVFQEYRKEATTLIARYVYDNKGEQAEQKIDMDRIIDINREIIVIEVNDKKFQELYSASIFSFLVDSDEALVARHFEVLGWRIDLDSKVKRMDDKDNN